MNQTYPITIKGKPILGELAKHGKVTIKFKACPVTLRSIESAVATNSFLKTIKNKATRKTYKFALKQCAEIISRLPIHNTLEIADTYDIKWLGFVLRDTFKQTNTANGYLVALNQYYHYLVHKGMLKSNPMLHPFTYITTPIIYKPVSNKLLYRLLLETKSKQVLFAIKKIVLTGIRPTALYKTYPDLFTKSINRMLEQYLQKQSLKLNRKITTKNLIATYKQR
jgi:hypothetical protein